MPIKWDPIPWPRSIRQSSNAQMVARGTSHRAQRAAQFLLLEHEAEEFLGFTKRAADGPIVVGAFRSRYRNRDKRGEATCRPARNVLSSFADNHSPSLLKVPGKRPSVRRPESD